MMTQNSVGELSWRGCDQPTDEEIRLTGGLLVEDWPHARCVMRLSMQLFEATYPLHKSGNKAQRLLERAAFLHNTGMMIDVRRHHKHSFRLIKETPLPDFTEKERYEIACIARYHRRALPSLGHEEYVALSNAARKRVSTLAALLRVSDALDYNHDGRVLRLDAEPVACDDSVWTIRLWTRPLADLDEELEHAQEKADLFEKVFNRKLRFVVQK
jgi:exopolyphosphatase/guanosine-5'-triphosphate,3'-diphosphate pyrophosphatase